jgi:hypothetical protein
MLVYLMVDHLLQPTTITATVIYFTALLFDQNLSLNKISVSEGTFKSSYKLMHAERNKNC